MNNQKSSSVKPIIIILIILTALNLIFLAWIGLPVIKKQFEPTATTTPLPTATKTPTPTSTATPEAFTPTPTFTATPENPIQVGLQDEGVFILSLANSRYYHLYAYNPHFLSFTPLTNSSWDDIQPSVSPDGRSIAFSSKKTGFWDIFILDLTTREIRQITATQEYDGAPTWSPDGKWIAFETYIAGHLQVALMSPDDPNTPPTLLTTNQNDNYFPRWSPSGREILFVSNFSGNDDVWLAKLDNLDDRFFNLSNTPDENESHPSWSPDGRWIAWAADIENIKMIRIWDTQQPTQPGRPLGNGDWPVWSPLGDAVLTRVTNPNQVSITTYNLSDGIATLPLTVIPGSIDGMDWKIQEFASLLQPWIKENPESDIPNLWKPIRTISPVPFGQESLVPLDGVDAPNPVLVDSVDEAFRNLRAVVVGEAGWDLLNKLEMAYQSNDELPIPGMGNNWYTTGRAIALNTAPIASQWLITVKEEIGSHVYWRVYLKAASQDGSQGRPLVQHPWDLYARTSGVPKAYEQGGMLTPIPAGYWVDFTELAFRFGWERQPALSKWVTYFPAARFNEFVMTGGIDWYTAMKALYPPEVIPTP
jgi:TolB protein